MSFSEGATALRGCRPMLPWRAHKAGRLAAIAICWTLAGFGITIVAAATLPLAAGGRTYTVLSGSMQPEIATGDAVVAEPISPIEAKIGDIVTFRDPGSGMLTSHRVRAVSRDRDQMRFVTRGDANNAYEHWSVATNGKIGRIEYRIPKLGVPLAMIGGPVRLALIVIPGLILCAIGLGRIWAAPEPDRGGTPDVAY